MTLNFMLIEGPKLMGPSCRFALKLAMPHWITHLNQTPTFKWYMVWRGFKSGHQKDTWFKGIGPRAQKHHIHSRLNNQHNQGPRGGI